MSPSVRILLAAPCALLLSACASSGVGPEVADLAEARQRWEAEGPASYVYAVERLCFCLGRGPARVTVEDGEVVSVEAVEPEDHFEPTAELFPSVDGLFEILADAIARDAYSIRATYDPETGVPTEFFIDYDQSIADEELGMRVTEPVTARTGG